VVVVALGAAPPVCAELPPALPVLEPAVDDDWVPVPDEEFVDDEVLLEPEPELELELPEFEPEPVESAVVPVAVPFVEVVPVDVLDEFSAAARLDEAVGSTRLGIVRGIGSETEAPPQALRTSPPRRAPSTAAGLASLGNASPRLGPCDARMSGSR
jgi:hypothetical protein